MRILDMHPLINGLVRELPDVGDEVAQEWRRRWLAAAEANLALLYPEPPRQIAHRLPDLAALVDALPEPTGDRVPAPKQPWTPVFTELKNVMYLRVPPSLKRAVEAAADEAGVSVNAWVTHALESGAPAEQDRGDQPAVIAEPDSEPEAAETLAVGPVIGEQDQPVEPDPFGATGKFWSDRRSGALLELSARGLSSREAALRINTSPGAVRVHLGKLRKLSPERQADLRRIGREVLWLPGDEPEPDPPPADEPANDPAPEATSEPEDGAPEPEAEAEAEDDEPGPAEEPEPAPSKFAFNAFPQGRALDSEAPRPPQVIAPYPPFDATDHNCETLVVMRAQGFTFGEIRDEVGGDIGTLARKHQDLMRLRRWQDVAERTLDTKWRKKAIDGRKASGPPS